MLERYEHSYRVENLEEDYSEQDSFEEIQELLDESHENARNRIKEEIEGEEQDLEFERTTFNDNIEMIYEKIDSLGDELAEMKREGVGRENDHKEHLEEELFQLYRRLLDQKNRWADRRTEIKRRIRDLERELQELQDSKIDDNF